MCKYQVHINLSITIDPKSPYLEELVVNTPTITSYPLPVYVVAFIIHNKAAYYLELTMTYNNGEALTYAMYSDLGWRSKFRPKFFYYCIASIW